MNIGILIMSTMFDPAKRNVESFKNTVIKDYLDNKNEFKNEYHFYEYYSCKEVESSEPYSVYENKGLTSISLNEDEGVYRTFEKTIESFDYLIDDCSTKYDFIVRINISTFINLRVLDRVINDMKKDVVYCNAINTHVNASSEEYLNDIYPRGDMMIMSYELMRAIRKVGLKYMYCDMDLNHRICVEHVDDCLIGICLIDIFGDEYYTHMQMLKYNFIPQPSGDVSSADMTNCIGSRVKTIPPTEKYSGYSWDDNEYRKFDCEKFENLILEAKKCFYSGILLENLIPDRKEQRPACIVQIDPRCPVEDVLWKVIKHKRQS